MSYSIRTQDGIVINNIPDDIPEDHPSLKQRVNHERIAMKIENDPISRGARDPTQGMGGMEKFNAGMGKAFTDLGRGAAQMVGMGPSADETRETRQLDAPLMQSGAGAAGNIAGNIAAFAPLAVVPGANAVAGAGALGAASGAFQPTESAGERLSNMAVGGGLGAGVQAVAGPIAQRVGEWGANKQAQAVASKSRNAVRDETIARGQEAGLVTAPSSVNKPSFIGKRMESLAGKAALSQEASINNQQPVDKLARRAAGLAEDQPINAENLRETRKALAGPYREISALSPQAARDLEAAQTARAESKLQWKHYNRTNDPAAHKLATAADAQMEQSLNAVDQAANAAGRPELVDALKEARRRIAQNHQVQSALNRGTGSVDPAVFGRALDNGAPLTGELETIARYQQAFPQSMREASRVPSPGIGKTELLASALLGGSGYQASDSPYGALAGLAPFASGPVRAALLSKSVQRMLARPNYSAGVTANTAAALENPETRRRAALLARAMALPAIPQAVNQ